MPLYVTNGKLQLGEPGKLAAQRACCCNEEGDNPEDCVCPDQCVYDASVTSPVSVRLLVDPCGYGSLVLSGSYDPFSDCPGVAVSTLLAPLGNLGSSGNYVGFFADRAAQTTNSGQYPSIPQAPPIETGTSWRVSVWVFVYCAEVIEANNTNASPKIVVSVSLSAASYEQWPRSSDAKSGSTTLGGIVFSRNAIFTIPSTCSKKSGLSCQGDSSLIRAAYFQSPFVLTVTKETVNGMAWSSGEFYGGTDDTFGSQENVSCLNDVINNFSATFRITQRQSCRIVNCDCSTSLDGLKATFEGKEFTLGTEFPYSETFDDYELITTHFKDFSGDYIFEKYKVLDTPAGAIGDVQSVKVFCEVDTEVDPQVPRWYAEFVSICRTVEANTNVSAETKRTEIGYFLCSESAGCAGRSEGDPIPLGSAQEIEEIPGSPETPSGTNSCTPPARADLTIFEDCG